MNSFIKIAPLVSIILSVIGAIGYAFAKDWGRTAYWVSAAVLTTAVTFWIKS
jgi:hypothetical protein